MRMQNYIARKIGKPYQLNKRQKSMKLILLSSCFALACLSGKASAEDFHYSYTFGSGSVIKGSFSGTTEGNFITGLSNIRASLNGVDFGPTVYGVGYVNVGTNAYAWIPGVPVVSFDGTQNNFMFGDNSMEAGHTNLEKYFYLATSVVDGIPYPEAYATLINDGKSYELDSTFSVSQYDPNRWVVTADSYAVPEPGSIALVLLGLGMAGLSFTRSRRSAGG